MSTAVLEPIVERPVVSDPAKAVSPAASPAEPMEKKKCSDPHPLLPVFVAGAISAVLAGSFIGTVLICLALRHSGIMAP